ncbi:MAG: hypothetical protein BroJett029_10990 [Alphaproteobacteria bacterium]|nr:MAG: hypothetical protein BroJett029_10990 [Alphaproteobacteria bacterium]
MSQSLYLHLRKRGPTDDAYSTNVRRFEDPLERWLKEELERLYAGVLDEPLPPAMAELVRKCEKRLEENLEDAGEGDDSSF